MFNLHVKTREDGKVLSLITALERLYDKVNSMEHYTQEEFKKHITYEFSNVVYLKKENVIKLQDFLIDNALSKENAVENIFLVLEHIQKTSIKKIAEFTEIKLAAYQALDKIAK